MLRRINQVLPELLLEMVIYGAVVQLAGMWFVDNKVQYTVGLWIGIIIAMGMAVNMAIVILDTVDAMGERRSTAKTAMFAALRYLVVVLAFVLVWYFDLGNLIAMFFGVMGLKVSAYLQPFTHKFITGFQKRGDESPDKV